MGALYTSECIVKPDGCVDLPAMEALWQSKPEFSGSWTDDESRAFWEWLQDQTTKHQNLAQDDPAKTKIKEYTLVKENFL